MHRSDMKTARDGYWERMATVLIVLAIAATAAVVVWFLTARRVPERVASHESDAVAETESSRLYRGVDRPAGPDAETTDPADLGGDQSPPAPMSGQP